MAKSQANKATEKIQPKRVRYVKLGRGGKWERECIDNGTIRFGFGTESERRFRLCQDRQWDEVTKDFIERGREKGTATRFTNELRRFFEDDGSTLWITFFGDLMYWGFLVPDLPERHEDGSGIFRVVSGGWHSSDLRGRPLTKARLPGSVTMLTAYRGTSCNADMADYVVKCINGETSSEVNRTVELTQDLKQSVIGLIQLLDSRKFETLVDLVFASSGWRRQGEVGGAQKTKDIELVLPTTGEKAFVQIKAKTNSTELEQYIERLDEMEAYDKYDRMFFVYHTGSVATDDERVVMIGPEKLSELVLSTGLLEWLIRRFS